MKFKAFFMVQLCVVTAAYNFQVLNSVIQLVLVDVMNHLIWRKFSSKMLFHYQSLLSKFLAVYRPYLVALNIQIPIPVKFDIRVAMTLPSGMVHRAKCLGESGLVASFYRTDWHNHSLLESCVLSSSNCIA
jgi:hypothetical protein